MNHFCLMCLLGSGTGRSPQAALVIAGTSPSVEKSQSHLVIVVLRIWLGWLAAVCEDCGLDDWEDSSEGAEELNKGRRCSYIELADLMSTVWDMSNVSKCTMLTYNAVSSSRGDPLCVSLCGSLRLRLCLSASVFLFVFSSCLCVSLCVCLLSVSLFVCPPLWMSPFLCLSLSVPVCLSTGR